MPFLVSSTKRVGLKWMNTFASRKATASSLRSAIAPRFCPIWGVSSLDNKAVISKNIGDTLHALSKGAAPPVGTRIWKRVQQATSKSQYWPWDLTTVCVLHAVVFSVSQGQDHVFLSPQHGTWSGRVEVVRPQERAHWNMKQKGGLTNTNERHKIHPDCLGGTLLLSLF